MYCDRISRVTGLLVDVYVKLLADVIQISNRYMLQSVDIH